jgi:hypothetical protein
VRQVSLGWRSSLSWGLSTLCQPPLQAWVQPLVAATTRFQSELVTFATFNQTDPSHRP